MALSRDIQWACVKNRSSFMHKQRGTKTIFTREPNNIANIHSLRYSGLINELSVGVEPAPDNKGVVFILRRKGGEQKPAKQFTRTTLRRGGRPTTRTIRDVLANKGFDASLARAAQLRASQILRSQKKPTLKNETKRRPRKAKKVAESE